jgi:hypothetical protein
MVRTHWLSLFGASHLRIVRRVNGGGLRLTSRRPDGRLVWSWREELNLQPVVYKTTALPLSYASPHEQSYSSRTVTTSLFHPVRTLRASIDVQREGCMKRMIFA